VLFIRTPRLECRRCCRVLNAVLPSVVPRSNYTKSFARLVVDLRKMMPIRDVARYLGVGEGMVRGIDKRYLQKTHGKPRLCDLEVIAIDEIYVGKRNRHFTIVIDWKTGAIVFVGEGKGQDALKLFWKRLRSSRAKIKAVVICWANISQISAGVRLCYVGPFAQPVQRFHNRGCCVGRGLYLFSALISRQGRVRSPAS
jgi:transposase